MLSFSNRSLIMLSTGSIGTAVNNAEALYEQKHSPSMRGTPLTLFTKTLVHCIWWGGFTYKRFKYPTNDLGYPTGN